MLYLHDSAITMKKKITLLSDSNFVLKGTFTFQTCDDVHCLPPFSDEFTLEISGCSQKSGASEDNSNEIMIIIFGLISLLIISTLILEKEKHEITKEIIFFLTVIFTLLVTVSWAEDPVTWSVKSINWVTKNMKLPLQPIWKADGIYILNF